MVVVVVRVSPPTPVPGACSVDQGRLVSARAGVASSGGRPRDVTPAADRSRRRPAVLVDVVGVRE